MPIDYLNWVVIVFGADSTMTRASLTEDILDQFQFVDVSVKELSECSLTIDGSVLLETV
ncbi:hypothetical protein PISMIDRAFT_690686 [Pisolithus microcarpus 441]|uniref:Uncharacterized protein n=1 Tax=Pisolithus microcarpus 441 TaxID=765257 RepID=A0A0C9Y189_9AGAM|nr:hypothetical protein PISMIDRAFT_690686 [Pisolithus microcarpus 441]